MKRLLVLLTAFLLLTACGAKAEVPEDAFTLPETSEASPISAEAIVTEGRAPTEDYALPEKGYDYDMLRWLEGGTIQLLAEAEDAAFYALPYVEGEQESALIRWGDSKAEFDWNFVTPRMFLPQMSVMDLDGDGEDELVILAYTGSGTGVSIYDLHVLEKNLDGTLTDYAMPESLWEEQVPPLMEYVRTGGRNFLVLGKELLELAPEVPEWASEDKIEPGSGYIAYFRLLPYENAVELSGAVDLWQTTNYVADYTANVGYRDGEFTLSGFHIQ